MILIDEEMYSCEVCEDGSIDVSLCGYNGDWSTVGFNSEESTG
jgi:hypothetical protein